MGLLKKLFKNSRLFKETRNHVSGVEGEKAVNKELNPLIFGKVNHRYITNLILLDSNNRSHQIDHIEIRENGIFCIETKNYSGWIFGSEKQQYWTQCLYKEKHQFLNPLKQNISHICQIQEALDKKYKINSLVVFVQNNAKKVHISNVVNLKDLKSYLKNYDDGTRLTNEEMDWIYNKLKAAASHISGAEHIQSIKQTQAEINRGVCPRCGGTLVRRHGKYGQFTGCSNYPNCSFILKNKKGM